LSQIRKVTSNVKPLWPLYPLYHPLAQAQARTYTHTHTHTQSDSIRKQSSDKYRRKH